MFEAPAFVFWCDNGAVDLFRTPPSEPSESARASLRPAGATSVRDPLCAMHIAEFGQSIQRAALGLSVTGKPCQKFHQIR